MENKKITLEKLICDLENLYSNDSFDYNLEESVKLANDIKKLQQKLSKANDKLKKIEEQCNIAIKNSYTYTSLHHSGVLTNAHDILEIINKVNELEKENE